jgi:hypothetical protein
MDERMRNARRNGVVSAALAEEAISIVEQKIIAQRSSIASEMAYQVRLEDRSGNGAIR